MRYFMYCRKSTEAEDRQVLSIPAQKEELLAKFGNDADIVIVEMLEEACSAKAPGRPVFDAMMKRIEKGEAEGIIAWHPDRLARNSIDGGLIIYYLDQTKIKDLKFATYNFENNSQGKFMLSIIFGYSKYYVDNLSENVKRGNRAKIARGWRPNHAPLGYLNDRKTKTIVKDPKRFPLMRRMFDLALTDAYSLRLITTQAMVWGLKTPKSKKMGGKYLSISNVHHLLTNPFYAGILEWNGESYPGAHKPMVTLDEFERVQRFLRRQGKPSPKRYFFPFTALIRCGECGRMITAENKKNRYGYRYTYYHCTRQQLKSRCTQPSVTPDIIDGAFMTFLSQHAIPEKIHEVLRADLDRARKSAEGDNGTMENNLRRTLEENKRALANLTSLRIRDLISEEEFAASRKILVDERFRIEQNLSSARKTLQWIEPAETLLWFSSRAMIWYREADDAQKRRIVQSVASNLFLKDKIVSVKAKKGFAHIPEMAHSSNLLGDLNEFRYLFESGDPEYLDMVQQVAAIVKEYQAREQK